MPRVKRGFRARRRRKKILKEAKGNYGARGQLFRSAIEQVHHGWQDAYRHRRQRRRDFRRLWIQRINAATRANGMRYSSFIAALSRRDIVLNRKILSDIAVSDPNAFKCLVDSLRS